MENKLKGCFLHNSDDWRTPKELYEPIMKHGFVDTFPYLSQEDELERDYIGRKLFINPPYSKLNKIKDWLIKQIKHNKVWLLIPCRTDTKLFQELIDYMPELYFFKGRLHFNNEKNSAPFPSVMMMFDEHNIFRTYDCGTIEKFVRRYVK